MSAGEIQPFMENWSTEQKEVWEMEEVYWKTFKEGDLKKHMELWHQDAVAWPHWSPEPIGRKVLEIGVKPFLKVLSYDIKPFTVNIFDKFAEVYYRVRSSRGDNLNSSVRVIHFWMKQEGRWKLIGGASSGPGMKEE
jgi:hypothetical protein